MTTKLACKEPTKLLISTCTVHARYSVFLVTIPVSSNTGFVMQNCCYKEYSSLVVYIELAKSQVDFQLDRASIETNRQRLCHNTPHSHYLLKQNKHAQTNDVFMKAESNSLSSLHQATGTKAHQSSCNYNIAAGLMAHHRHVNMYTEPQLAKHNHN